MREQIIGVLKQQFQAQILKHKMNIEVMLSNPMAIHDHTDLMGAIEKEVAMVAEYKDRLEVMNTLFNDERL